MRDERDIAAELRDSGGRLWSSVESERVLKTVLERRLEGGGWMAAVQWSERLCKTFIPHDGPETAAES